MSIKTVLISMVVLSNVLSMVLAIKWLHISDVHVDMKYHIGSPSRCYVGTSLGTMCCRSFDIPLNTSTPCGKNGNMENDIPPYLFTSVMNWISENIKTKIDFIINTGDDGSHKDINQVFTGDNLDSIKFISKTVGDIFPNTPFYRVVGNHDGFPNVDQTFPGYKTFLKDSTKEWTKWVSDPMLPEYGFYSINITSNLTIIAMNSLYYDTNNYFAINDSRNDHTRQFDWVGEEFNRARVSGRKVLLLNHLPIFTSESNFYHSSNLIGVVDSNQDIILAVLNGHSHRSRFELYNHDNYTGFALINPSIFTDSNYPSFRIYDYDKVLDFDEYTCDISGVDIVCKYEYSFLEEYGLKNIDLDNLVSLYERMVVNATLLDTYVRHYSPPQYDPSYNYLAEIYNKY